MKTKIFNSSVMLRAAYDETTSELRITFTNGRAYSYPNVPASIWKGFDNAKSEGRYFNNHIRSQFTAVPLV